MMKLLRYIVVLLGALCILVSVSSILWQQHSAITTSHAYLHTQFFYFALARWFLIGLLIALWPIGIHWLSNRQQWSRELTQILLSRRWYLLGFFIAMEGLIIFTHY